MPLSDEHVGPKILAKIKICVLTRAELLITLCYEMPCNSFFSAWSLDFKNVIFEKIHRAHSEVIEVKRSFSRSQRPNFGFHLVFTSFHLEFSAFWISRSFDLGDLGILGMGPVNVFKNYIFEISAFQGKRWGMSQLSRRNFQLNLSTEEGCKKNHFLTTYPPHLVHEVFEPPLT